MTTSEYRTTKRNNDRLEAGQDSSEQHLRTTSQKAQQRVDELPTPPKHLRPASLTQPSQTVGERNDATTAEKVSPQKEVLFARI